MTAASILDLYLRKSKGMTLERQRDDLTAGAAEHQLTIGRTFADPDRSASRYRRRAREDFTALTAYVESGDCHVIGIAEASRGSRDLTEWSTFLDLCRARHVRIFVSSHDRIYDLARRRDWRALADEGLDAADESEKISERTLSGKRRAARDGTPPGRLQYGFTRTYDEKGEFVAQLPHPDEAPVVAEVVARVADGDTLYVIAADLTARGIMRRSGKPWHGTGLGQLILSPSYAGRRIHQGQDVGPACWKPIVDVDQWHTAVALLSNPDRRTQPRGTRLLHWLANVALCGRCRATRLASMSRHGAGMRLRYGCRACHGCFVDKANLETFVERAVLARLAQPDALAAFQPVDDPAVTAAEQRVKQLNELLEEHYTEARAGRLSARGLSAVEGPLLANLAAAEAAARRAVLPPALRGVDPAEVIAKWPGLPAASRRTYTLALVDLVVAPATRRGPGFDRARLAGSRWTGDALTWGEQHFV